MFSKELTTYKRITEEEYKALCDVLHKYNAILMLISEWGKRLPIPFIESIRDVLKGGEEDVR